MANVIYRGKSITFPDDMSEAEISQQMPLIADQIDVELESEAIPEEVAVPEEKGFFSKAADLYAERWKQGQDMVKSALGKYESVTEKANPDETPSIERRGGPIKADVFEGIKAQYEQLPPDQRERFLDKQGAIGNAFRNVDEAYKATDATERKTDNRIESRQQRLLDDGLAPETARNIAQQGGDETTVSSIKAGVPDREVVDYALDTVRDIEKIGFTTGKMAVDTLRLSGEYIPVVGDMLIASSDFASEKIAEIAQTQSPELQAKSFELQRLLQDGKRTQVTDFLAANPSVLVSTAIPSAGSIFLTAAPGVAIRGLGASEKLATNVTVSANAALNAGAAFSEAEGGPLEKYTAAFIAGAGSLAVGKLTEGGLEGAIARGNIGDAARSATGLRKVIKGAAEAGKVAGKEYLQEFGEGSSEALGVQTSEVMTGARDGFSAQEIINQGQVEGAAGLLLGGGIAGVNAMLPKDRERNERQLKQQRADAALDSIQNAQSVDEAVGNALASIDTPIDAPISLETENVSDQIDATGLADATTTPELDNQQGSVPVDVRAGGSGLIHEGRADGAGTLEPGDGIDLDAGISDRRPDAAVAEGQVQAKVDIGSGVIVTSSGTPYKTERGATVALKGKGLEGTHEVTAIGDGFGIAPIRTITREDANVQGAGQGQAETAISSASNAVFGDRQRQVQADGQAAPAGQDQISAGISGNERTGSDASGVSPVADTGIQQSAEQPDSLGAEIRPIVESIAKRRAAAQQINKEKAFDTALGIAKRMLAGEQVKPGQLQMAARQLKNDAELFEQVSKLVEIAKAPAKAARAERAQSAEVYRSRISQAKTEEELQAIAAEIAKDTKLTDTQAADLDDAVMEAMDALDDSGSNDAEEKLAEQIADEVVAEVEADPSALEPKPGDSENEAYLKEQINERIEQEDGKQAVADAEGQAEADIADGSKESGEEVEASEVNVESDLSRVDAGQVLINAKDGYRIQKVGDKYHYSAAGNAEFKTEKLTRDELLEKLAGKKMPTDAEQVTAMRDALLGLIDAKENLNVANTSGLDDAKAKARIGLLDAEKTMRDVYGKDEATPLIAMSVSDLYALYDAVADGGERTQKQYQSTDVKTVEQDQPDDSDKVADAVFILAGEEYGALGSNQEAITRARQGEDGYVVLDIGERPSGKRWHTAYVSDGAGGFDSVSIGPSLVGVTRESILEQGRKARVNRNARDAKSDAMRKSLIRGAMELGIKVGMSWNGAQAYVQGKKGITTYDKATISAFDESTGIITVEVYKRGMRAPQRIATTYESRLFETYPKDDTSNAGDAAPVVSPQSGKEAIRQTAAENNFSDAQSAINSADIPTAEKIRLTSELRKGEITPEDVKGVLNAGATEKAAEQQPKSSASEKIEDVGEKMAGARKDMEIAARKEWSDEDLAAQPLSKIWPVGDIDAIEDPYVAAWAFASRAEIPSKPRKGYRLAAWVAKVKSLRLINAMALDGFLSKDKIQSKLNNFPALKDFDAKVRLLERLPREQWKRIGKVREYPNAYTYDASGVKIGKPQVTVEIDGRSNSYSGGTIDEAIDGIMERVGIAAPEKRMQFEVRGSGGKFHIYKKGDSKYHKLSEPFADPKDAFAFIKESYDELVAAWDGVKDRENVKKTDMRSKSNKPRTGQDWRKGRDVGAEEFASQFGFRGVEFGLWVKQGKNDKERQGMVNQAYDALMDLASILNIPPRAISLNGSIGLAFGSRGKGWAAAHYEPGNLVINLTKTKGAGNLAHEWFHALDNYFSRMRDGEVSVKRGLNAQKAYRESNYITYRPEPLYVHKTKPMKPMTKADVERYFKLSNNSSLYAIENWEQDKNHPVGVRPEVEAAFADLVKVLNESPMRERASAIDGAKENGDGYWSRIIERAARSFENYAIHKMLLNGYQNDYLANVVDIKDFARDEGRYPYLLENEIAPVAEAFDTLFSTIQTKETDKGVAMFSRSGRSKTYPQLLNVLEQYEGTGEIATVSDLVDEVEALIDADEAPESLQYAINDYREELAFDNTLSGRGDMDAAEERFIEQVRAAIGGSPSFSRQFTGSGIELRDAEAMINRVMRGYKNLNKPKLFANPAQLKGIKEGLLKDIRAAGAMKDVEAAFHEGEIYVFLDNVESVERLEHVLFNHEVGHYGLRGVFGQDLDPMLDYVLKHSIKLQLETTRKQRTLGIKSRIEALEEVIVDMRPEELVKLKGWNKVAMFIRNWLESHGFTNLANRVNDYLTGKVGQEQAIDMMVADMITKARNWAKNGKRSGSTDIYLGVTRLSDVRNYDDLYAAMLPNWGVKQEYQGETGVYNGARAIKNKFVALVMPEVVDHIHGLQGGGDRIVEFEIRETKHGDRIGSTTIEMRGNKPVALHDIAIDRAYRGNGYAKQVVGALLSAAPGRSMEIIEILDSAEDFWRKSGVHTIGYTDGNATLTWRDFAEANPEARGGKENKHGSFSRSASRGDAEAAAYETADAGSEYVRQRPAVDQTQTPQFRNWFGDSVVTDNGKPMSEGGKPLVVYHATTYGDFDTFQKSEQRKGMAGYGFYFTNNEGSNIYADYGMNFQSDTAWNGASKKVNVMPVYLNMQNPLIVDNIAGVQARYGKRDPGQFGQGRTYGGMSEGAKTAIQRDGYDGVIAKEYVKRMRDGSYKVVEPGTKGAIEHPVYVVFEPTQIKSATGNNGQFDPANPDIRFSRSGVAQIDADINAFKEKNRRIREEDVTIWRKSKKWLQRQLSPGGLLPKSAFDEKIKRDSQFAAIEFDVAHMVSSLERAIKSDFGVSAAKLDEKVQSLMNDVLSGKAIPESVPEQTRVALVGMRQYIDGLSEKYMESLRDQMDSMIEIADGNADSERLSELEEKVGLYKTIMQNMGHYVHRSYKAFDDQKWFSKVPDDVLDNARRYLIAQNLETMGSAEAERRAENLLEEMLKNGTAYDSMDAFIRETKLGAKDLSVLKKRKEIAPEIRALLGEYQDPRVNFAKSATKMGRLIFNQRFLESIQKDGMGIYLFTDETKPSGAFVKIAADSSEVLAPLNGLWVTPEINQAFKDAVGKENIEGFFRAWVRLNGMVKFGKTVLSPTTAARNWMSAYFFTLANGHFNLKHIHKSVSGLREYFGAASNADKLAYLRELKELGVVYDTPYAGEMIKLLEDSSVADMLTLGKYEVSAKKSLELATKFYQYGDDFWKIVGFENEKSQWIKTGLNEQAAKEKAAERVRNTYPTYSMVGRGIQYLRRFPLVGTFVSFPAEIIRTSGNMLRYVAEDMKSPETRPMAVKRMAGMSLASSFAFAAQAVSMALLGFDDDDDEATRLMSAPWQRNSTLIYTGRDKDGNLRYLDISFLDPYNYWKRPLVAIWRGQPWQDTALDIVKELGAPFFGEDILFGAVKEVFSNKKESGGKVFNEHDSLDDQAVDIFEHLRKSLQPGIASNMERTWKAINGETSPSGRKYDLVDETAAWVGFRMSTLDPKVSLYYRSFEFGDAKSAAEKRIRITANDTGDVDSSDLVDSYEAAMRIREEAYGNMITLVKAAERSGMSKIEIRRTLKNSGISQADIFYILNGKVPKWLPKSSTIGQQYQKAKTNFGDDQANKVRDRYMELRAYSASSSGSR